MLNVYLFVIEHYLNCSILVQRKLRKKQFYYRLTQEYYNTRPAAILLLMPKCKQMYVKFQFQLKFQITHKT